VGIAQGGAQRVVQIGTVEVVEGRTPPLDGCFAERNPAEQVPRMPVARVHRDRRDRDPGERVGETDVVEDAHRVRADGDACADLAEHARLLVDVDLVVRTAQRQRGGQASDPGADDGDPHAAESLHPQDLAQRWPPRQESYRVRSNTMSA